VDYLEANGIVPGIVIDEGGAVVENVFPGVTQPCAMVGIAEKGMLNLSFSVTTGGGHASSPPPHTPVGVLSAACVRLENHPFPMHMTPPALQMFDTLARRSTFLYRLIFANLAVFRPLLDLICRKNGGEMNALVRTTVAFTQMEGSKGMNVLPAKASMLANLRLMHGDTVDSALARIRRTVNDERVTVSVVNGNDPSRISRTDCEAWESLRAAISATWPEAVVTPYLMMACSDSRHYGRISDRVYRFSPMTMNKEERGSIHGNDERVPVSTIEKSVEFYLRILHNA
jgi:carboxypeptidase PM20D1